MALSDAEKEAMRADTYEAAAALASDFRFMRGSMASVHPSGDDVRLLSGMLRRMILEDHLVAVAAPRIGRVKFEVPDYGDLIETVEGDFVTLGFAPFFGFINQLFSHISFTQSGPDGKPHTEATLAGPQPTRLVSREKLLSDRVCRFEGQFITRQQMLQFICYHAFGVHYTGREEPAFKLIRRFMYKYSILQTDTVPRLLLMEGYDGAKPKRLLMNLAHAHTFSTGYYLIHSPDVIRLQSVIEAEVAGVEGSSDDGPH